MHKSALLLPPQKLHDRATSRPTLQTNLNVHLPMAWRITDGTAPANPGHGSSDPGLKSSTPEPTRQGSSDVRGLVTEKSYLKCGIASNSQ
ncbi:hypothetical protein BKA82DRAFT_400786 [Pisolithus tinctorius]|uniref:Uncharacterized protein n=1 Tax=Pisolithus tinctorius Marx 270 TaxID=870435 RepID=A0A0C3PHD9_PISTI|nr:hypothetical protein BKA82DRAFT_400786 [Pisolithus tinctorius]KIO07866.1 hypothetical protein M404DRAFT_400786 [Pisolithus tinctorius Marx 270]